MIRDTLALKGPKSLGELAKELDSDRNVVQALLIDLTVAGEVYYDYDYGTYNSDVVL
jgi:DNA-binding IclR family transcriptional regulator